MHHDHPQPSRRRFLGLTAGLSTSILLAGCGGGGGGSGGASADPVSVVPAAPIAAPVVPGAPSHPLALVLNLAYIGAQYHGVAATGAGLPAALTGGTGQAGTATGARRVQFADPGVERFAAELAADKQAQVAALRARIGADVAAQPMIDLSSGAASAFTVAAQGASIVAPGVAFDPYADDVNFLHGAFMIENMVAAAYRRIVLEGDAAMADIATAQLADAIYHGGLVRALLEDKAAADPAVDRALANAIQMQSILDGSNIGDQTIASENMPSSNVLDAGGRAIPFTRSTAQVLTTIYLTNGAAGGFLPRGANAVQL